MIESLIPACLNAVGNGRQVSSVCYSVSPSSNPVKEEISNLYLAFGFPLPGQVEDKFRGNKLYSKFFLISSSNITGCRKRN